MMRRKNLERAIVLGLLLSTSVCGNVWAEDDIVLDENGNLHDNAIGNTEGGITIGSSKGIELSSYDKKFEIDNITVGGKGIYLYNTSISKTASLNLSTKNLTINVNKLGPSTTSSKRAAGISSNGPNLNNIINMDGKLEINYAFLPEENVGTSAGVYAESQKTSGNATVRISADSIKINNFQSGIFAGSKGNVELISNINEKNTDSGNIIINYDKNYIVNDYANSAYGIEQHFNKYGDNSNIKLIADKNIEILGVSKGIYVHSNTSRDINNSYIELTAANDIYFESMNIINDPSAKTAELFGIHIGYNIDGNSNISITSENGDITLKNFDRGIYASEGKVELITNRGDINIINEFSVDDYKPEYGIKADGTDTQNSFVELKAGNKSTSNKHSGNKHSGIKISGFAIGVRSSESSTVNLNGDVTIVTKDCGKFIDDYPNSYEFDTDLALIADSGAAINLNTTSDIYNNKSNIFIDGNIVAATDSKINIGSVDTNVARTFLNVAGQTNIIGNIHAGNNGIVNINLGNNGSLTGRVDDYQDADSKKNIDFYDPYYWEKIIEKGFVNINMGNNSIWDVTGQSWVTKLDGSGVVDMRNGVADETSHAVHIGELSGNHTFVMDLDTEHSVSDMLFIKDKASGEQKLWINNIKGYETLNDGDRLRFATVNDKGLTFSGDYTFGSYENVKNGIMLADNGVIDNAFVIKNEKYDVDDIKEENEGYNGGTEFNEVKPGDKYVDKNYENATNWFLEKYSAGDETSDAGKTIINMSKVNYSNAIYMDRLNKRLGEARYINPEEEQGMWVRIRHDRIGKDDAFRSQNTMYEMGYDEKQDCDNGERRVGFAVDYMDGKAEYSGIAGDGDVKRYGLWLYDTWLGDKGHYTDYVLKWGHLENDFDIYTMTRNEKVSGDYSNNVFSASAEYGKKNDMGSGWYFEPQAQLQFARVTGADYVTSQDTKVSLDGINSLIGRAGFRLGRDLNKNSTVYIKADLLHEFLGDQDITATDATGTLREEYENEGTWYDVGFGFATALGNSSYAFMDFEKSFGNDNDETYQINAGVQWTF